MGTYRSQNEELRENKMFEEKNHKERKNLNRDGDGRIIPEPDAPHKTVGGEISRRNDGGAHGRNNGGDKSGR